MTRDIETADRYGRWPMADLDELARRFRESGADHHSRSPFHARLCAGVADDPDVVALLAAAPEPQQLPVLLMASVHWIVLAEPDLPLARYYPTTADLPEPGDPYPAFRALCLERADEIRSIVATRRTQTNEIGRCALFLPALGEMADEVGALALVDVGTSAGLNLQLDRFGYTYTSEATDDAAGSAISVGGPSTVELTTGIRGAVPVPDSLPPIGGRVGLDRDPVDLSDPAEARWLRACVWPDQADRSHRLEAAIGLALAHPAGIRRGDAVDGLVAAVDAVAGNGHPVVLNSWVLNYLEAGRRHHYVDVLDTIGRRHDLSWVFAESPTLTPELPWPDTARGSELTVLARATWRSGRRHVEHLGNAHPHGYWLHWNDG